MGIWIVYGGSPAVRAVTGGQHGHAVLQVLAKIATPITVGSETKKIWYSNSKLTDTFVMKTSYKKLLFHLIDISIQ